MFMVSICSPLTLFINKIKDWTDSILLNFCEYLKQLKEKWKYYILKIYLVGTTLGREQL